jgi:predicted outer membrane repeat protein
MRRLFALAFLSALAVARPSPAKTLQVRADGKADASSIAGAIQAASAGDTVLVHPGVYVTGVLYIENKDIVLRSAAGPEETVLDGRGGELIAWIRGGTEATVLEGFTIRDGYDPQFGGGIRVNDRARPVIRNNIFEGCRAPAGGGIYVGPQCKPRIEGNLFRKNLSTASGGAVYAQNSAPVIKNNTFVENNAEMPGSAIALFAASPVIENNLFVRQLGLAAVHLMNGTCKPTLRCNGYFGNKGRDLGTPEGVAAPAEADRRTEEPVFADPSAYRLAAGSPYLTGPCGRIGW